jgi:hypothetical protein
MLTHKVRHMRQPSDHKLVHMLHGKEQHMMRP